MALDIVFFVITAVLSFVIGILLNTIRSKVNKDRMEDTAIKDGLRCLLREQIIIICDRCNERGSMKMHDLESIEDLHKAYTELGGNGTVEKLVDDTKKLKVV